MGWRRIPHRRGGGQPSAARVTASSRRRGTTLSQRTALDPRRALPRDGRARTALGTALQRPYRTKDAMGKCRSMQDSNRATLPPGTLSSGHYESTVRTGLFR